MEVKRQNWFNHFLLGAGIVLAYWFRPPAGSYYQNSHLPFASLSATTVTYVPCTPTRANVDNVSDAMKPDTEVSASMYSGNDVYAEEPLTFSWNADVKTSKQNVEHVATRLNPVADISAVGAVPTQLETPSVEKPVETVAQKQTWLQHLKNALHVSVDVKAPITRLQKPSVGVSFGFNTKVNQSSIGLSTGASYAPAVKPRFSADGVYADASVNLMQLASFAKNPGQAFTHRTLTHSYSASVNSQPYWADADVAMSVNGGVRLYAGDRYMDGWNVQVAGKILTDFGDSGSQNIHEGIYTTSTALFKKELRNLLKKGVETMFRISEVPAESSGASSSHASALNLGHGSSSIEVNPNARSKAATELIAEFKKKVIDAFDWRNTYKMDPNLKRTAQELVLKMHAAPPDEAILRFTKIANHSAEVVNEIVQESIDHPSAKAVASEAFRRVSETEHESRESFKSVAPLMDQYIKIRDRLILDALMREPVPLSNTQWMVHGAIDFPLKRS